MLDRTDTLVVAFLLLNVLLVLFGALGLAWDAKVRAGRPLLPTHLALHFSPTEYSSIVRHDN